jgi:Flp pilus assembly pilin Flp
VELLLTVVGVVIVVAVVVLGAWLDLRHTRSPSDSPSRRRRES